ncbi:MAG: hypothetical protein ACON3Z_02965 [Bradymonadia bacterium]
MGTRPAKIAGRGRDAGKSKACPSCNNPAMTAVKFVRQTQPSGIFWLCDKCGHEQPTR